MSVKKAGQKVLKQLNEAGYAAYFVGGMVRDTLLDRDVYDADITTDATPDQVLNLFDDTYATGLQHGTVTVLMDNEHVEVTTFRLDGDYLDNRRPEGVEFTRSLSEDLARRDFTINAIAQQIDGTIVDPFGGQVDLDHKIIRTVGKPIKRFEEDALRILRGIRFVAKLGFDIEEKTLEAMKACRHLLGNLSPERIRKEFEGIIEGEYKARAFEMMLHCELFANIPYFSGFGAYPVATLAKMDDFKLMLLFAADGLIDATEFLEKYPLTKDEKKLIKNIKAINSTDHTHKNLNNSEIAMLLQYHFGIETVQMKEKFAYIADTLVANNDNLPYKNNAFVFTVYHLPIIDRREIAIQPTEVIKASGKEPGPWLGKLFTEIEEAVVLGKIKNTRNELVTFLKERGVID